MNTIYEGFFAAPFPLEYVPLRTFIQVLMAQVGETQPRAYPVLQGKRHYDGQIFGGETEKKQQAGSCAVKRGRGEETKAVRNRLMWAVCFPPLPGARVTSGPGLLLWSNSRQDLH